MNYNGQTLWFKQCPRDTGDLCLNRDVYGHYIACLQCGYYLTEAQMAKLLHNGSLTPVEDSRSYPISANPSKN